MKHRFIRNIVFVIVAGVLLVVGFFLGMNAYYREIFPAFTWVNSVYCTGKTVTEVNEELLRNVKAPVLTITDKDGNQAQIDLSLASYTESYEEALNEYVSGISDGNLISKLTGEHSIELEAKRSWDRETLDKLVLELPMIAEELARPIDMYIDFQDGEYILQDHLKKRLDEMLLLGYVAECMNKEQYDINLADGGCYVDYSIEGSGCLEVVELWAKLDEFMDCGIVYDMGAEQIVVDRKTAAGFIALDKNGDFLLDENGNLLPDEEALTAFIDRIVAEYDTVGTELAFEATRGETVMVPYKKYGTRLDRDAEVTYFLEAFQNDVSEVHIPKYKQEGYVRGKDDIGTTYIEIDMTEQKMYAYVNGVCEVETDIVTGNMRRGWDTPAGVNYVYAKQKNRILRGADYASFVSYWMPVNGGIGIHDATWRSEFGGEIYKKNGSHGCINTPKSDMKTIYELYEVGTPVIMFY